MNDTDDATKRVEELVSEGSRQHFRRMLPIMLALYSSAERAVEEGALALIHQLRDEDRAPTVQEIEALDKRFDAVALLVNRVHQCRGALELYRRQDAAKAQQADANVEAHKQLQSLLSAGEDDDSELPS